jgi:hypothetical protein
MSKMKVFLVERDVVGFGFTDLIRIVFVKNLSGALAANEDLGFSPGQKIKKNGIEPYPVSKIGSTAGWYRLRPFSGEIIIAKGIEIVVC